MILAEADPAPGWYFALQLIVTILGLISLIATIVAVGLKISKELMGIRGAADVTNTKLDGVKNELVEVKGDLDEMHKDSREQWQKLSQHEVDLAKLKASIDSGGSA